jgi:Lipase (class 3)
MNVGEGLKYVIWVVGVIVAIPLFFLIVNGKVFLQAHNTVVIRDKGHLRLGPPGPDGAEASLDLPFAQLSAAGYEALLKSKDDGTDPPRSNADIGLNAEGWNRWADFPLPDDQQKFQRYNLRVEVWHNRPLNAVVVTFGGTDPKKLADWFANFRWFIPHHDDEYTQVVKAFQPLFTAKYQQLQGRPDYAFLGNAKLYATGHSLGGGLAQEFAYSVPNALGVPRVAKVYAFDPSPVTGYYSVDSGLRDSNKQSLAIDRIYQRREILAILRSFMNLIHRPSAQSPVVREVRYNLFTGWNPVHRHSISELSDCLAKATDPPQPKYVNIATTSKCK